MARNGNGDRMPGGMVKGKGFESPFPGDNKDCYSNSGVGDYSKSYPRFSDQDGMRGSASHDGDASYNTGGSEPTGETFPTRVGRGMGANMTTRAIPGGGGSGGFSGKVPGGGLPPPYGHKGHRK